MNNAELFVILQSYEQGTLKVLGPWRPDTMPVRPPWHSGSVRCDPIGEQVLYCGHLGSEPVWGCHVGEGVEGSGGQVEADAWARENGYKLVNEEESK